MNEQQQMLADTLAPLFAELGPAASLSAGWAGIEEVGLTSLLLAEESGGFGGGWAEALIAFRLAGYHAVALPVVEAVLAARFLADGATGFGSIGERVEGEAGDRFSGVVHGVPWGGDAAWVLAPMDDRVLLLDVSLATDVVRGTSVAGEPRDTLTFADAPFAVAPIAGPQLAAEMALARVAQIAGALDAALGVSVAYVNERTQFGRPIAKFQAVQQALATFATEAAAVNCAAMGAFAAQERDFALDEIAAAKLRANMAVGVGTATAHQVHGAIGFTHEYALHPLTRRLWSWRSEFGGDRYWADVLGTRVAARGDRFWADMVDRSDPVEA